MKIIKITFILSKCPILRQSEKQTLHQFISRLKSQTLYSIYTKTAQKSIPNKSTLLNYFLPSNRQSKKYDLDVLLFYLTNPEIPTYEFKLNVFVRQTKKGNVPAG